MSCTRLAVLLLGIAQSVIAQTQPGGSLLRDGGYERWERFVPKDARSAPIVADGLAPTGWVLFAQAGKPNNVKIARDASVRHGGAYCVRLTNAGATDIGEVDSKPIDVQPNQPYRFRLWYKAQSVAGPAADAGIRLVVSQMPGNSQAQPLVKTVMPKVKDGTFDWRLIELVFTTRPTTRQVTIGMQLNRAAGTVWFDDATLIPEGPTTTRQSAGAGSEASVIFQADFNGDGQNEGGSNDVVTLGGQGVLSSSDTHTASISGANPLGEGGGNYLSVVSQADTTRRVAVRFLPSAAGSLDHLYSVDGSRGRLNGAFEVFIRPNEPPADKREWLWPMVTPSADSRHQLSLMCSSGTSSRLRFQLKADRLAFGNIKMIVSRNGYVVTPQGAQSQNYLEIQTQDFRINKPGQTYHLAWAFETDSQGVVTMSVYGVEGSGPIDAESPLAAATFNLDATQIGARLFGTEGWMISISAAEKPANVDYDCVRVYDRAPRVFAGLSGSK